MFFVLRLISYQLTFYGSFTAQLYFSGNGITVYLSDNVIIADSVIAVIAE